MIIGTRSFLQEEGAESHQGDQGFCYQVDG